MSTATTKLLTAEEFSKLPNPIDGSKQELVRGEVITMSPPSLFTKRPLTASARLVTIQSQQFAFALAAKAFQQLRPELQKPDHEPHSRERVGEYRDCSDADVEYIQVSSAIG